MKEMEDKIAKLKQELEENSPDKAIVSHDPSETISKADLEALIKKIGATETLKNEIITNSAHETNDLKV